MDKKYLEEMIHVSYPRATVFVSSWYDIPQKALVLLSSSKESEEFIAKYNDNFFDKSLTYKLKIEKTNLLCLDQQVALTPEMTLVEETFKTVYEKMFQTHYSISPKYPGLLLTHEDSNKRWDNAVSWLIKRVGSTLLKGQSIMNISLPVFIFDQRTMLQVFAYEMRLAPYLFQKAYYTENVLDKLKLITTFALTQLHFSTIAVKPFSPIIGETYQCKIGDFNIYCEQTVPKPPTFNFYCFDDNRRYKYYGYVATSGSTGANSVKASKIGNIILEYADGQKYKLLFPTVHVKGTTIGKKTFNYKNNSIIIDETNELCSITKYNPDEKGFFSGMFSNQKSNPDKFVGSIIKLSDLKKDASSGKFSKEKTAKSFCEISGEWTKEIKYDNKVHWKESETHLLRMFRMPYLLLSDSTFRPDLLEFTIGDEETAQQNKEMVEEIQRNDRKLRAGIDITKEDKKESDDDKKQSSKDDHKECEDQKEKKLSKEEKKKKKKRRKKRRNVRKKRRKTRRNVRKRRKIKIIKPFNFI